MISAIVAVDNNWGIGYKGDLLINIPEDLKRFKTLTTGNTVIMGKKTWESLPKKPLPNRLNIIIDYTTDLKGNYIDTNAVIQNMESTTEMLKKEFNDEFFIIGGGSIYKQLLPYCDRVYVTKIYKDFENVDTYFPNLDNQDTWISAPVGEISTYKDILYQYWVYDRI